MLTSHKLLMIVCTLPSYPEIINSINSSGKLEEDSEKALTELIVELKKNFN